MTRRSTPAVLGTVLLLCCRPGLTVAQTQARESVDVSPEKPVVHPSAYTSDKTGTNPLNFQRTFQLTNEYDAVTSNAEVNFTRFRYTEAFRPDFSLRLEVPLVYAHATIAGNSATGDDDGSGSTSPSDEIDASRFGLGDVVLKASYVPFADHRRGILFAAELAAPTASDDVLGTEKWVISPAVTYAIFLPKMMIFAPTYKHSLSFAGDGDRNDINKGTFDFYLVKKFDKGRQWINIDPTYLLDFENDQYSGGTLRVTYGRLLGKMSGAVISGYVKPGVGVGSDRPNDWSAEVGVSLIGF